MSQIGGPIQAGLAGTTGSQETTGRAKARRENQRADRSRRFQDAIDLTVSGVTESEVVHALDENDEHSDNQRQKKRDAIRGLEVDNPAAAQPGDEDARPGAHIDLTG